MLCRPDDLGVMGEEVSLCLQCHSSTYIKEFLEVLNTLYALMSYLLTVIKQAELQADK